jgi:CDP-glucose 4,6-dehydratase
MIDRRFYQGKRVFLTGHTGFKGTWMSRVLVNAGSTVTGYSLEPPTQPNLFSLAGLENTMMSVIGDIRNFSGLKAVFDKAQPEIVIHLAAQPIVRDSYKEPALTYETNVMGTVNLLECVRLSSCVRSFLNVTTDKVYENREWEWGYRENESLDGFDPYSNSKSCSELVTHSYARSFFPDDKVAISTARAGNVIGGGDFAHDRIIPDCIRAVCAGQTIIVRNPHSTRPYQHVLEPTIAYLMLAARQYEDKGIAGWYNVGPDDRNCVTTEKLVDIFCKHWGSEARWKSGIVEGPHEAGYLTLDCSKIKKTLGWYPRWHIEEAVAKTCEWTKVWIAGKDVPAAMDIQIAEYLGSG